ncbi:MAG: Gfo/Idh/MocA family oxidoreductase [Planctomycetes bacterium]|nr:Gfo/Idh/MocA family oxidoreductase [Planctomycetota bacterium]
MANSKLSKVRFGVIGLGAMGVPHARGIVKDNDPDFCLGAICDIDQNRLQTIGAELNVAAFNDAQAMYDSGMIDAVIIATQHYWHAPQTVLAARAGLHVLCEKPLSSTVGHARTMVAECKKRKVALGMMFQQRTKAIMMKMKQMVESGELGDVIRVQYICSNWFRTQAYYNSGSWRGTWDGEGGGVLINQAPHSLDLFQWIAGMPKKVFAAISTRCHKIEVEDTADIICMYDKGKIGYIYVTTAEEPGIDQFIITGDKATLVAEGGKLKIGRLLQPISQHIYKSTKAWPGPDEQSTTWSDVDLAEQGGSSHILVIRAFAAHLLRGEHMVVSGAEGINGLELSNAAYLSGYTNKVVKLPVKAQAIESLFNRLQNERSTGRGGNIRAAAAKALKKALASKKK